MPQEADNAWKDLLDAHLEAFFAFFFPAIHADIDWTKPVDFLDKELARIVPQSFRGMALVDKLVRVSLRGGKEAWIFIHIEVQGYSDPEFEVRMLRYNLRLRERYGEGVVSLAVLTDAHPRYRPSAYEYTRWGFQLRMGFPVVKILDYRDGGKDLAVNPNPFAVVVLAHLAKIDRSSVEGTYRAKWRLIKLLYQRGQEKEQIRDLLRFIDWILRLPGHLEARIMNRMEVLEEQQNMPYLSNIERRGLQKGLERGLKEGLEKGLEQGLEKGREEGLREAIALGLELRFGANALNAMPRIEEIKGVDSLSRLKDEIKKAPDLEAFLDAVAREGG